MRIDQQRASGWGRLNPATAARSAWDRFSAHPIQGLMSMAAGMAVPGGGRLARSVFDRYNDSQFTGAADWLDSATQQQGNRAEADAWRSPLDGLLGQFGAGAPAYPGANLPMAQMPWSSTPGVQGGWIAPGSIMDFLGQPQAPTTPDGTGVTAIPGASGARGGGRGGGNGNGAGWSGVFGGGDVGGHAMIRGVDPRYRSVYNGRRYGNGGV